MMTTISTSTVFARPLCRYSTQFGPVIAGASGELEQMAKLAQRLGILNK